MIRKNYKTYYRKMIGGAKYGVHRYWNMCNSYSDTMYIYDAAEEESRSKCKIGRHNK